MLFRSAVVGLLAVRLLVFGGVQPKKRRRPPGLGCLHGFTGEQPWRFEGLRLLGGNAQSLNVFLLKIGAESPNSRNLEATVASKRIGAKLGAAQLAALQRCTAVRFGPVFGGMNPPKQPILILWGQPPFLKNIALERQNITMEHKNSITMQALIDALEQESLLVDFSCPRQFYSHTFTDRKSVV